MKKAGCGISRRRFGSTGGFVAAVAAVLPLLVLTSACSREGERRVVAPAPLSDSPQVTGARWVWEPAALAGAVQAAGKNPLVQRALSQAPIAGLRPRYDLAVRAVGSVQGAGEVGVTILPYAVNGDPTHAAFISVAQGSGQEAAEFAEMILGRNPNPDEIGYHSIVWGNQVAWVRSGDSWLLPAGGANRAPLRRQWTKLFDCLAERMPTGCAAGASIASELVPGEPRAAAVGCGIGAAAGAISCVADFLRDK
jgi:hypothetical protein